MASSLSRRLYRALLTNSEVKPSNLTMAFCTKSLSTSETSSDSNNSEPDEPESSPSSLSSDSTRQFPVDRPLENGIDGGIYKAILVGQVGQNPLQKLLRSGRLVTLLSLGTGGIRNNRRPMDNEEPKEYANRCAVQWHRVSIYPERLGNVAMKHIEPGSILYVEGNLETKVFTDPVSGLVRRVREIAVRRNGRLVSLGKDKVSEQSTKAGMKDVGYY